MKRYSFGTFIAQGFAGVFRHGLMSTASIFVLASTLLIMGCFGALIINIDYNLDSIDDFNELVCYINLDADEQKVALIGEEIKKLDNIESCTFVSKSEALDSERKRYGEEYSHLFDDYGTGSNPLPHSYRIQYKDAEKVDVLVYELNNIEGIDKIKNRLDIADTIAKIKSAISLVCMWLMVMLLVVSFFVIANTIKLAFHSREHEISIMRYIGATKFYITMPFIIEGLIIGLCASIIGYFAQWYIYTYLTMVITSNYNIVNVIPFEKNAGIFALVFLVAGVFVSVFGSALSARKYMKV